MKFSKKLKVDDKMARWSITFLFLLSYHVTQSLAYRAAPGWHFGGLVFGAGGPFNGAYGLSGQDIFALYGLDDYGYGYAAGRNNNGQQGNRGYSGLGVGHHETGLKNHVGHDGYGYVYGGYPNYDYGHYGYGPYVKHHGYGHGHKHDEHTSGYGDGHTGVDLHSGIYSYY